MAKKRISKKKPKKIVLIGSGIILGIIILVCLLIFFIRSSLDIKVKGKENIQIEVGTKYKDKGATAKIFNINLNKNIVTNGKVNVKKIGKYKINYSVSWLLFKKKAVRTVKVIDKEKPTIKLKGNPEVNVILGSEYKEEGYEVEDNYDKKLEDKVKVTSKVDTNKVGTYEILYEVKDSSGNKNSIKRKVNVIKQTVNKTVNNKTSSSQGKVGTYINGLLIVNKKYHLPATYNPGENSEALAALGRLQTAARSAGFSIPKISGFRSYTLQQSLYSRYVAQYGEAKASTFSAKPGQSEHQTGLAFDVGALDDNYGNTPAGKWLASNAYKYGFIIRYLKGKEGITGYQYEPWHIRYVGTTHAKKIYDRGVTLEEYLGVA